MECDEELFLFRYSAIESLALDTSECGELRRKGAQYFLECWGFGGSIASPFEWARTYLIGKPITSVMIERVNRGLKRVRQID